MLVYIPKHYFLMLCLQDKIFPEFLKVLFPVYKGLNRGAFADADKTYDEYIKKVETAGLEKVRAAQQKQVDEFFKNK